MAASKKTGPAADAAPAQDQDAGTPPTVDIADGLAAAAQRVGIDAADALAWRAHGDHVTVVTVDGRKLNSADVAPADKDAA